MDILQIISIITELAVMVVALAATLQGKTYMCGLTITFAIYVFYDLARLYAWNISGTFLSILFFIATVAALYSVGMIFTLKSKK